MECRVEYAKSDRAKCKGCSSYAHPSLAESCIGADMHRPMKKHSVKVGKHVQSPFHDGMMTLFFHPKCFFQSVFLEDVRLIKKLSSLRWKDQVMLEQMVEKSKKKFALPAVDQDDSSPTPSASVLPEGKRKRKRSSDTSKEPSRKRRRAPGKETSRSPQKMDASAAFFQRTTEHWWKVMDCVEELSAGALATFLKTNGVDLQDPTREQLMLQSTHAIVHGIPQPCHSCGACFVYKFGRVWDCTGQTEWAKCPSTLSIEDANVRKAVVPAGKDWAALRELALEPVLPSTREALESEELPPPISVRERLATITDYSNKGKPLYGCAVAAFGKLCMTQGAIKKLVENLGGKFSSTVTAKVTHCISTHDVLSKQNATNQKLQKALDLSLPIYGDGLLGFIEENQRLPEDANSFLLEGNPSESDRKQEQEKKKEQELDESSEEVSVTATFTVKGKGAVDPKSGLEDKGHVFVSDTGVVFSATLSATDVVTGRNSFYMLQVIQSDRSNTRFWLWRRWGRTGTYIGNSAVSEYRSVASVIEKFESLFEEKTGNRWEERSHFKKKKGKFNFVETEYDPAAIIEDGDRLEEVQRYLSGVNEAKATTLPPETVRLIQMLFDVEAMNEAMLEMKIDTAKLPLGVLSKNQIKSAFEVLSKIQHHIEQYPQSDSDGDDSMLGSEPELLALCNKYYAFIPHDFGTQAPPLLASLDQVAAESQMLQSLVDMEIATQLMRSCDADNPIDTSYQSLHARLSPVDSSRQEFSMVEDYLRSSHGPTHTGYKLGLVHLFEVERDGEAKRYEPFRTLHNRQLLWHGSRTTNFAGILAQGLRIAPPEAPVTGYMFGKGIYFAESASKSANYCHASKQNPYGILLLCEAALGDPVEYNKATYVSKLPEDKHSVQGMGRHITDPEQHTMIEEGLTVPMGKCIRQRRRTALEYNEFVVYDVAQVLIRYAMIVHFEFRRGHG